MQVRSATDELILSERHHRAHRRMWAAVNMSVFGDRQNWTDDEQDTLVSMLGLDEEWKWVTESKQQKN